MQFLPGNILHVYNRGNNRQLIFFDDDNYVFFINKVWKQVSSVCDILAYCLMPNHFHFLVHVNEQSCKPKKVGSLMSAELQNGFRMLQSSYAGTINRQFNRTSSLFQQNTHYKLLDDMRYIEACFHYIHQNPLRAGLVNKLEDWSYSSFREYLITDTKGLCNKQLLFDVLAIEPAKFYEASYEQISDDWLGNFFLTHDTTPSGAEKAY